MMKSSEGRPFTIEEALAFPLDQLMLAAKAAEAAHKALIEKAVAEIEGGATVH